MLILCFPNLLFFVEQITHSWRLLPTFLGVTWRNFLASVLTITSLCFILAGKPIVSWWSIAAVAVSFSWLSVGFNLQLVNFGNMGIYLIILMKASRIVFTVLALVLFFLLALGIHMYLLVGHE